MTSPSRAEILAEMRERVAALAYVEAEAVTPEARFVDDLGIDSLSALALVIELEERYGIRLRDSEVEQLHTVAEAVDLLAEKLSAA